MKPDETRKRICEIDYLKGILILLMVTFHLVYIEELYPYAKQVVYTFHMPCFLFFSGYLMNTQKDWEGFLRTLGFLLIPYTIMESGYILMASMLSIREAIEELTVTVWIEKLFLHPIGPYWYLQTMVICGLLYYIALRYLHVTPLSRIIILGISYYYLAIFTGAVSFVNCMYFLAGAVLRRSNVRFLELFQQSVFSVIAFLLLIMTPHNLTADTVGSVLIVFFFVSSGRFSFQYLPTAIRKTIEHVGQNTLPVFLFSPIFTFMCKVIVPFFRFDSSGILFLVISLVLCVSGSLIIGMIIDTTGMSSYLIGRTFVIRKTAPL